MIGIYHIVHTPSGRAYVGSSDHVARRLRAHRSLLNRGEHDNVWLQRTWDRDGPDAFVFLTARQVPIYRLRGEEQADIDRLRETIFGVFNFSDVVRDGSRAYNAEFPDSEVRAIVSDLKAGMSIGDAAAKYGSNPYTIGRILRGETYTSVTKGVRAREQKPACGVRSNNSRLTDDAVREIRRRHRRYDKANGTRALAKEFGVTELTIYHILSRKTWRHI